MSNTIEGLVAKTTADFGLAAFFKTGLPWFMHQSLQFELA